MGEQAAKIGKKLEGFGVNFFANLGWTELTQDKEIKCTRSSHKKKTHGIDLLCKFTNPYIAGNQGIVVECKNRQMGSITRATIEEWVKELINNIECAQSAPELVDVDLRNTTLNTGLLLIHANDKFDQQKFYDHLSKIAFPNRRNPINIFIAANDRIAQWTSLFAKVKTSYNNGFSFIYPSMRIDVGSRRNIAVSQPLLNFFQADAIGIQKARTAMSEIVIAYLPQSVFLQNIGKALCEIARLDQFPDLIDIDIVGVLGAVRPSAQLAVLLLLCFQAMQQFLKRRDKGQAAVAGLRLCAILLDDLALAINGHLRDRMTNGDRLFLEVDSV